MTIRSPNKEGGEEGSKRRKRQNKREIEKIWEEMAKQGYRDNQEIRGAGGGDMEGVAEI